ncbi:hypothetical protein R3P38DRAFT_2766657 [Favolaschia claudopus]|uniref:Oxidase ustYa n=1 Tax=Favolaschia claudopus TaxID=2862362 RepID=A0AAW0D371_9AGAR
MSKPEKILPLVALALITILNMLAAIVTLQMTKNFDNEDGGSLHFHQQTARGILELPIRPRPAAMKIEATEHYGLEADEDWVSLMPSRRGFGFVRLGERRLPLEPSIYHQLHCLSSLRQLVVHGVSNDTETYWHIQHCLNSLRQAILCNADTTLEPSFMYQLSDHTSKPASSGMGVIHTCKDWTQIRSFVEDNQALYSDIPLILS